MMLLQLGRVGILENISGVPILHAVVVVEAPGCLAFVNLYAGAVSEHLHRMAHRIVQ